MDISYYKNMEPFWGVWYIEKELGSGSFGKVFKIKREDFGRTYYAALKVISLPGDQGEISSLKAEGMNEQSISDYYESFVMEIVEEYSLMAKLKGNSNIVSYEDHTMKQHEDGIGYDVIIRMELLTPLNEYISREPLTENSIIQLGIDMCKALEVCGRYNIIHRDIKPENIFVSSLGLFKLGDFGVSRIAEGATQGMSVKGTISYMAPEVYKGLPYNSSVDIYSLGVVLYKLSNNNRGPFLPPSPETIKHADRERAENLRIGGEIFPDSANASPELMAIIRKAVSYNSKDRFSSAAEFRECLEELSDSKDKKDYLETQSTIGFLLNDRTGYSNNNLPESKIDETLVASDKSPKTYDNAQTGAGTDRSASKTKKRIIVGAVCAALLLIAVCIFFLAGKSKKNETESVSASTSVSMVTESSASLSDSASDIVSVSEEITETDDRYYYDNDIYEVTADGLFVLKDIPSLLKMTISDVKEYMDSVSVEYDIVTTNEAGQTIEQLQITISDEGETFCFDFVPNGGIINYAGHCSKAADYDIGCNFVATRSEYASKDFEPVRTNGRHTILKRVLGIDTVLFHTYVYEDSDTTEIKVYEIYYFVDTAYDISPLYKLRGDSWKDNALYSLSDENILLLERPENAINLRIDYFNDYLNDAGIESLWVYGDANDNATFTGMFLICQGTDYSNPVSVWFENACIDRISRSRKVSSTENAEAVLNDYVEMASKYYSISKVRDGVYSAQILEDSAAGNYISYYLYLSDEYEDGHKEVIQQVFFE